MSSVGGTRTLAVAKESSTGAGRTTARFLATRSEARRLLDGLERFREVVVDFQGVPGIGQGFADEIFRVWANAHPDAALSPVEMNEDVRFFVERAIRARERADP